MVVITWLQGLQLLHTSPLTRPVPSDGDHFLEQLKYLVVEKWHGCTPYSSKPSPVTFSSQRLQPCREVQSI